MGKNVSQKSIGSHLVEGRMEAGQEIGLKIDQTLTQDATGTMVMLELEAMNLSRVKTELSAQYVDHNLLSNRFQKSGRSSVSAQRLQKVWDLVQPSRKRREPSGAHGALRRTWQNVAGLG